MLPMVRAASVHDDFALLPLLVQLFSRALVHVQEENLRQVGDGDNAGFICGRQAPLRASTQAP